MTPISQAAAALGISRHTLYNGIKQGLRVHYRPSQTTGRSRIACVKMVEVARFLRKNFPRKTELIERCENE